MKELTTSEVVALFGVDERRVRKDVEYGILTPTPGAPRFALAEVVYLVAVAELGFDLGIEDRRRVYRVIAEALVQARRPARIELGGWWQVRLADAVREVEARLARFARWKAKLVQRDDILGGTVVFPQSRLAVQQVGEMSRRGAPVEEILEDYPYITEEDVAFARQYVIAYPRVGRPRDGEALA
jgi:uncharacterized protein (DUF433 family)